MLKPSFSIFPTGMTILGLWDLDLFPRLESLIAARIPMKTWALAPRFSDAWRGAGAYGRGQGFPSHVGLEGNDPQVEIEP